ncbi:MAG TPA: BTAD domain-containing putative transcriptional regulator [Dongiaceae bacterium]|nr:BTAD domain-containing putative transcriptional regulator [Dongiaceae bacterium]
MTVAGLTLLGTFGLTLDGRAVDIGGQKERALLAVLALSAGTTQPRDKLATLLWGDHGDVQARDSLKHALNRLRQGLAEISPALITGDRQAVTLDPAGITIDVRQFEQAVAEGTPTALHQAAALYAGDLLDGIGVRDRSFEDWLLIERRRLRQLAEAALVKLLQSDLPEQMREYAAMKLLALDPLREAAYRSLMQLHVLRGETAQAVKLYETLRDRLHAELGVKPEADTIQLFEATRRQETRPRAVTQPMAPLERASLSLLPALPSKPSIAVLPFQNLSDDPGQAYFADGMAEEIITALSRMRWLFVIARNSSFAFRGKAVDIKHIGEQLGVRYILEGSVRKAANKVRIMGQLVDAATGANLWADRFEGELADVFDLQDQVASSVVGAISPKLEQAEIERAKRKPTDSLDAYDLYLRGIANVYSWTKGGLEEGLRLFYQAIDRDTDFAAAYGVAAWCYYWRMVNGWMTDRNAETAEVIRLVEKVSEIGKDDAVSLAFSGQGLSYVVGDAPTSLALIDRALILNPNLAAAWSTSGCIQACHGDPDLAVDHLARAMRLSPLDPLKFFTQTFTSLAHFVAGRYDLAWPIAEAACHDQAHFLGALRIAAASNVMAGRQAEAEHFIARALRLDPDLRIANLATRFSHIKPAYFAKYVDALRRAGLPE